MDALIQAVQVKAHIPTSYHDVLCFQYHKGPDQTASMGGISLVLLTNDLRQYEVWGECTRS
eukprot:scaffold104771_cov18-Tisochrysis_lutea.AAC.1